MKKLPLTLALLLLSSSFAYAQALQSMDKKQVMKALENKTITTIPLVTLHGNLIPDNTASIFFDKEGKVSGQFSSKPANDPQSDQGTWQVKADGQTCVTWQTWTQNKPICVYAYKLANSIVFVNVDKKFESMVLADNIQSGNQIHS